MYTYTYICRAYLTWSMKTKTKVSLICLSPVTTASITPPPPSFITFPIYPFPSPPPPLNSSLSQFSPCSLSLSRSLALAQSAALMRFLSRLLSLFSSRFLTSRCGSLFFPLSHSFSLITQHILGRHLLSFNTHAHGIVCSNLQHRV